MSHRVWVLLLAGALTGCAESPRDVAGPMPTRSAAPVVTQSPFPETSRCENPEGGYALQYPFAWSVAGGPGIEPCTFFDQDPLALEPGTEATGVAIRTDVRDLPLEQARRDQPGEQEERGPGRVRATGTYRDEVLLPAGTRFTTWLLDLAGRTLLITTDTGAGEGYDEAVEVLDAMAQTVEPLPAR